MKRITIDLSMLLLIAFTATMQAVEMKGQTFSSLGEFEITKAENPIRVDGKDLETYMIRYQNSDKIVYVGVNGKFSSRDYLVVSPDLTAQYTKEGRFFGVKKLDEKYAREFNTNTANMDRTEYFHQRVITQDSRKDEDFISLIAVYYPKLVKDTDKAFAVR